jgi:hypothetical protein
MTSTTSHPVGATPYSTTITPYSQQSALPQQSTALYATTPNAYTPSLSSAPSQRSAYPSFPQQLQTSSPSYKSHAHTATGASTSALPSHGYPSVRQPSRAIPSSNQSVPLPASSANQLIPQLHDIPGLKLEDLRLVRHECTSPNGTVFPAGSRPFKTKLCNNYELQGVCPRESQCTYAHGSLNITCKFCAFGLYQLGWQNTQTGEFYGYIQLNNGKIQLSPHQQQILKQLNNDANAASGTAENNNASPATNHKSLSRAGTTDRQASHSRSSHRSAADVNEKDKKNDKQNDVNVNDQVAGSGRHDSDVDHDSRSDDEDPSGSREQHPHDLSRSYRHMNHRHRRDHSATDDSELPATPQDDDQENDEEYHDRSGSRRNSQSPSFRWWSHNSASATTPSTPAVTSTYTTYSPPTFSRRTTASSLNTSRIDGAASAPREHRSRTWSQASTVNTVLTQDTYTRTRDSRTNTVSSNATNQTLPGAAYGSAEVDDMNYASLSFDKQMIATAVAQRYRLQPPIASDSHIDELPSDVDLPDILYVSAEAANDAIKQHFLANAILQSSLRTAISIVVWRQSPASTPTSTSSTSETNEQRQERLQQTRSLSHDAAATDKHEAGKAASSDKEKSPASAPSTSSITPSSSALAAPSSSSSFKKQVSTDQQHLVAIASKHILVVIDLPNALASTIPSALIELLQTASILKITTNDVLSALQTEQITCENTLNIHSLIHLLSQKNERLPLNALFEKYLHVKLQENPSQLSPYITSVNPAYGAGDKENDIDNDKSIEFDATNKASGFDMQHTASAAYLLHSLSMMIRETWRRR